jgi:hypothetical protein
MKLKKLYKHDNGKQIWRILPTSNNKVVIEERDVKTKEVFFNCLEIESGKKLINSFQLEEKNWVGIESIYGDIIFFHAYGKPDMPSHKSIIVFDILSKTILWKNDNYVFSFVVDNKVYCYQQRFESRVFFALDYLTGNIVEDLGSDFAAINHLKEKADSELDKQKYVFPEDFNRTNSGTDVYQKYLQQILADNVIKGEINYLVINDLLFYNYHEVSKSNSLTNIFTVVELQKNKILLNEILDKNLNSLMPESFFVKDNFLFLIIDKIKVSVYQIIE